MKRDTIENGNLTEDRLQALILSAEPARLADALSDRSEAERKHLAKRAFSLHKRLMNRDEDLVESSSLKEKLKRGNDYRSRIITARLAVMGVGSAAQAKKLPTWYLQPEEQEILVRILTDRRPVWLDSWLAGRLEDQFPGINWRSIRTLVRAGACTLPESDGFVRLVALDMSRWRMRGEKDLPPLSQRLKKDWDILEPLVYRLFEIESMAFTATSFDKKAASQPGYESWTDAVAKLSKKGFLDRNRLLDASLGGLLLALNSSQLAGFRRVHERLDPQIAEIEAREAAYLNLLGTRVGHVVTFALKTLSKLEKAKKLDGPAFFEAAAGVFSLPTKGTAKKALKLGFCLARSNHDLQDACVDFVVSALGHPDSDVQELGIEFLESNDITASPVLDRLRVAAPLLNPALQRRALRLCGEAVSEAPAASFSAERFDNLSGRIDALLPEAQKQAGIDRDTWLVEFPAPLQYDVVETCILSEIEEITPIPDVEALIDTVAHAAEVVDSIDEVERIMDGLSRLCDRQPQDFELLTAPLLQRLKEGGNFEAIRGIADGWAGVSQDWRDLLLTWITGKWHATRNSTYYRPLGPFLFIRRRLEELKYRVHKKEAAPLLSAPTHRHGWIDPRILAERIELMIAGNKSIYREDLTQALLRLAPDGRAEALRALDGVAGSIIRIVRWALGGSEAPASWDQKNYALWVAAGRAREPRQSLRDVYQAFSLLDDLPDSIDPAGYEWKSTVRESKPHNGQVYTFPEVKFQHGLEVDNEEPAPASFSTWMPLAKKVAASFKRLVAREEAPSWKDIPTAAMHRVNYRAWQSVDFNGAWLVHWIHYTWPLNTDSSMAAGVPAIMSRIDENTAAFAPNFAFLEPAFESYRPWKEITRLVLWLGMVSKDNDLSGYAIDAMIEGVEDGRGHPDELAAVLVKVAEGGWIKLNRLAGSLRQVASVSDVHRYVVARILDRFIADVETLPGRPHPVLALMVELFATLSLAPSAEAIVRLKTITGASKSAKLAKKLRSMQRDSHISEILAQVAESRLDRAERRLGQPVSIE